MKNFLKIIFITFILFSCSNNSANIVDSSLSDSVLEKNFTGSNVASVGNVISSDPSYNSCIESAKYSCGINFINSYLQTNSSTDVCDNFGDENLRLSCYEMVITETAKKTLDLDRCRQINNIDNQAICIQNVITTKGIKESDPTVCSNYVLSSSDIDTIENMKDRCVVHIIDQLEPSPKTKGLCGLIINQEVKDSCENKIQSYIDLLSK